MSRVIQGRQNCNQNLDHCARGVVRCLHETGVPFWLRQPLRCSWSAPTRATSCGVRAGRSPRRRCAASGHGRLPLVRRARRVGEPVAAGQEPRRDQGDPPRRGRRRRHPLSVPRSSSSTLGDYPLVESPETVAQARRRVPPRAADRRADPPAAPTRTTATTPPRRAWRCRPGCSRRRSAWRTPTASYPTTDEIIGAPPVFFFEPHQPEQSDFKPNVLLDITAAFPLKQKAMECLPAQKHMWEYYTVLADPPRRAGQAQRRRQPRPAGRHDGRGVHALLPAGHGRPAVTGHRRRHRHRSARMPPRSTRSARTARHGARGDGPDRVRRCRHPPDPAGRRASRAPRSRCSCCARRQPHGPRGDRAVRGRAT